ncbi:MAG: thioredoxin fold domain-containing protein [Deltaproteobacteria bacterium]|nr:thioredoxin fold domain-containing protein [Deltaproteobacteria bacterium]
MGWFKKFIGIEIDESRVPVSINDDNYQEEIANSELPVLIDLWGPGCAPCKQLAPIIADLAKKYSGKVKIAECNVADAPGVARKLRVRGTPTVVYLKKGKEVERVVGFKGSLYHTEIIETEFLGNDFTI